MCQLDISTNWETKKHESEVQWDLVYKGRGRRQRGHVKGDTDCLEWATIGDDSNGENALY